MSGLNISKGTQSKLVLRRYFSQVLLVCKTVQDDNMLFLNESYDIFCDFSAVKLKFEAFFALVIFPSSF